MIPQYSLEDKKFTINDFHQVDKTALILDTIAALQAHTKTFVKTKNTLEQTGDIQLITTSWQDWIDGQPTTKSGDMVLGTGLSSERESGTVQLPSGDSISSRAGDIDLQVGSSGFGKGGDILLRSGNSDTDENGVGGDIALNTGTNKRR